MFQLYESFSIAIGFIRRKPRYTDDIWRAGHPLKATALCSDEFERLAAGLLEGLREEDAEGVDFLEGRGEGEESKENEDIGGVVFH